MGQILLDVLIVNYNTAPLLAPMFRALNDAASDISMQCLVVDNASSDDSIALLRANHPDVALYTNEKNVGFGRANNQLLEFLKGRYVLLLNTDAFITPDTLLRTLEYMEGHAECGVLGVRLTGRDGALQPSCRYFPTPLNVFLSRTGLSRFMPWVRLVDDMEWDHASVRECDWVPGCYYLIRREVINQVGLFDPRFFLYYEEVDHCWRVKEAGWKVMYFPDTTVVHIGGESARSAGELTAVGQQISALQIESEILYFRKNYGLPGLVRHMLLVTFGDVILSLKAFIKGRGIEAVLECSHHLRLTWRLLWTTRFATRATR